MSNSPTKAQLRAAFIQALATVKGENETLNQQCDAAKEESMRIQKECDIMRKLVNSLKEQRCEAEKKCCTASKNAERAEQELQKEIKTKQYEVKKLQEQFKDMKNSMTASVKDKELSLQKEINVLQKEIIVPLEGIIDLQKEINVLQKQLTELEPKLVKTNYKLQEANKKLELHTLRLALYTFEKVMVGVKEPQIRGDEWQTFFATNDYENLLEEEGYKGSVRSTVLSLFSRMDNNAHDVYNLEQDLLLTRNNFNPDEVQFLTALWKIQPLNDGSLIFVSSDE